MDFARLVALLDHQALHFARADQFDDRFEAASGTIDLKPRWDAHYLDFFRDAIRTAPGSASPPPDEEVEREAARLLREFSQSAALDREHPPGGRARARMTRIMCSHFDGGLDVASQAAYLPCRSTMDNPLGRTLRSSAEY